MPGGSDTVRSVGARPAACGGDYETMAKLASCQA